MIYLCPFLEIERMIIMVDDFFSYLFEDQETENNFVDVDEEYIFVLNEKEQKMSDNLFQQANKLLHKNDQGGGNAKYRSSARAFCDFTAKEFKLRNLRNISNKHLRLFAEHRARQGKTTGNTKTELSAIRKMHSKIDNARYTLEKDNKKLGVENREIIKNGKNIEDKAWTEQEYDHAREYAIEKGFNDVEVAMRLSRNGGLRIEEVTSLSKRQINEALTNGSTEIRGKGGIWRTTYADNEEYRQALKDALNQAKSEHVFQQHGRNHKQAIARIRNFINRERKNWSTVEEDNKKGGASDGRERASNTMHGLRHRFARDKYYEFKKEGLTEQQALKEVSKLLGHGRAEVTKIYL